MENYRGADYLDVDHLLSDDERLVRDFDEREIQPIIAERAPDCHGYLR